MLGRLFELVTGRPWVTVRSMAAEFGPPPGLEFHAELSRFSDAELYERGDEILAEIRTERALAPFRRPRRVRRSDRVAAGPNAEVSSSHVRPVRSVSVRARPSRPGPAKTP